VNEGIWVMNADGSNPRLVASPAEGAHNPSWSLDGRSMVFACLRDLCVVNADGTGLTTISSGAEQFDTPNWGRYVPPPPPPPPPDTP
jgi:Tol biopolymer transport system component